MAAGAAYSGAGHRTRSQRAAEIQRERERDRQRTPLRRTKQLQCVGCSRLSARPTHTSSGYKLDLDELGATSADVASRSADIAQDLSTPGGTSLRSAPGSRARLKFPTLGRSWPRLARVCPSLVRFEPRRLISGRILVVCERRGGGCPSDATQFSLRVVWNGAICGDFGGSSAPCCAQAI